MSENKTGDGGPAFTARCTHMMPIWNCYQCRYRDEMKCRCLLTARKHNRHPGPDKPIPQWCTLLKMTATAERAK